MTYDPSTKTPAELEADLIKAAVLMERSGLEWAEASSLLEQMEDLKKVVLSDSMPPSSSGSHADRLDLALRSDRNKQHLAGLSEARLKANIAKVKYTAAQAKFDALRTVISSRRELFKRGIES